MNDTQKLALQYLSAICNDYGATMPPSVRGPVMRECQTALAAIAAALEPAGAASTDGA